MWTAQRGTACRVAEEARHLAESTVHREQIPRNPDRRCGGVLFPERAYKAALTAAQRPVGGLVKADLLRRYRTERFQTVWRLSQKGVEDLWEAGFDAASSVWRVSDMSSPEHRLWTQFLVLASEARGLQAMAEQALLRHLNVGKKPGEPLAQGLLPVEWTRGSKTVRQHLRPDGIAFEPAAAEQSRRAIWFEVDRSKRSSDRESALSALVRAVGRLMADDSTLSRVVVSARHHASRNVRWQPFAYRRCLTYLRMQRAQSLYAAGQVAEYHALLAGVDAHTTRAGLLSAEAVKVMRRGERSQRGAISPGRLAGHGDA